MILVAVEVALVTAICLVIIPSGIVMLAAVIPDRMALPVARLLRKRKTGRRFQRPVYQRAA